MSESYVIYNLRDNGGRRSGIERRRFSYSDHIPDRRSAVDRRVRSDRRSGEDRRKGSERRSGEERRIGWAFGRRRNVIDRRDATIL
jgi:hypothetical protein